MCPWARILVSLAVYEVFQGGVTSNTELVADFFVNCAIDFSNFHYV